MFDQLLEIIRQANIKLWRSDKCTIYVRVEVRDKSTFAIFVHVFDARASGVARFRQIQVGADLGGVNLYGSGRSIDKAAAMVIRNIPEIRNA